MKRRTASSNPATGLSGLPSMTALLEAAAADGRFSAADRATLSQALSSVLDEYRARMTADDPAPTRDAVLAGAAARIAATRRRRMVRVINATGVVLHTNLGRAPLSVAAVNAVAEVAGGYCNLELDLDSGERGGRAALVEELLCELTGAPASLIVNNNAAATLLVLSAMAAGREVIVSRGQLVEIGGSYRLPDVVVAGGAILREVGTTNKTRLEDYSSAICERTAMLMRVHTSNYRIVGFSDSPSTAELAALARRTGLPLFDDLGSGALRPDPLWSAADEPTVSEGLLDGADLVSFSGDKLLGGPQSGVVAGRRDLVETLRQHPLARALRVDKMTLAGLQVTLEQHRAADAEVPVMQMLRATPEVLRSSAEALAAALRVVCPDDRIDVAVGSSVAGGGSLPADSLPTYVVRWTPRDVTVDEICRRLRVGRPPVIARIHNAAVVLDVRSLLPGDAEMIVSAVRAAQGAGGAGGSSRNA